MAKHTKDGTLYKVIDVRTKKEVSRNHTIEQVWRIVKGKPDYRAIPENANINDFIGKAK